MTFEDFQRSRFLTDVSVKRFGLTAENGTISYPVGKVVKCKRMQPKKGEGKNFWAEAGKSQNLTLTTSHIKANTKVVYWLNGEPSLWAAEEAGLPAACGTMGEGRVPGDAHKVLAGKEVIILADKHETGEKLALETAQVMADRGGLTVRVFKWPHDWMPDKGDFGDLWIATEGARGACMALLEAMIDDPKNELEAAEGEIEPDRELKVYSMAELLAEEFPPVEWVASGMLPKNGLTLLHGPSETGKSFVLYDLMLARASNRQWLEKIDVEQGVSLLWDEENGPARAKDRFSRLGARSEMDIHVISNQGLMLTNASDMQVMLNICLERGVSLLGIDTMIAVHDLDENKANEIRKLRTVFRPFSEAGITVIGVIHDRKGDGSLGAKLQEIAGSRDYGAMADAGWQMVRVENGLDEFKFECSKLRDGSRADTEVYHIEIMGSQGQPLTVSAKAGEISATLKWSRSRVKVLGVLERFWHLPGEAWATRKEIGEEGSIRDPRIVKIGVEALMTEKMENGEAFLRERTREKEDSDTRGPKAKEYRLHDGYFEPSGDSE